MPTQKDYVILIHGLDRTAKSMRKIEKFLAKKGYNTINLDYPSTKDTIQNLTNNYLKKVIKEKCTDKNKKIHFVAHSMGGIMVRYFLATNKLKNLGRIVMLAPPNKGAKHADLYSRFKIANLLLGPALKQMTTSKKSLPNTLPKPDYEVGIIAAKYDGKVSIEQTKLPKMKDFLVVPSAHTFIMQSNKAIKAIDNFIKKGRF